jgi:hypothetical protein
MDFCRKTGCGGKKSIDAVAKFYRANSSISKAFFTWQPQNDVAELVKVLPLVTSGSLGGLKSSQRRPYRDSLSKVTGLFS